MSVGLDHPVSSRTRPVRDWLVALLVASGGFALIRPDWFHLQNGLDPFFYVGLSLNLEDFISQGGDAHYFISRWTLFLPELLFTRLLGSSAGFVAMRICLLALVAWAILHLRNRSDRWLDSIVVTLAVAFSPLVLRAVFVDYSDAIVVPFGLAVCGWKRSGHGATAERRTSGCCCVDRCDRQFFCNLHGVYQSRCLSVAGETGLVENSCGHWGVGSPSRTFWTGLFPCEVRHRQRI